MPISFPAAPSVNDTYTYNGKTWKYNGTGWVVQPGLASFQAPLVSGTNIKTVNSTSLLGSGDVPVQAPLVSGTNIKTINGQAVLGSGDLTVGVQPKEATYTVTGNLSVGAGTIRWYFVTDSEILSVFIQVSTAPTGADIIVDVNKNAAGTIFTTQANRPTIATSEFYSSNVAPYVPDITTMAAGDYLLIDIDQVGSTVPGADLIVRIIYLESF